MFETRAATVSDLKEWETFLNSCFEYTTGESYQTDFFPLFQPSALGNARLGLLDGKIIASGAIHPVRAKGAGCELNMGIIGAVATHPSHRGHGYSKQILTELEQMAVKAGLDALILWSDQQEFYAQFHFERQGLQWLLPLAELPPPKVQAKGKPEEGWDFAAVQALYEAHPLHLKRRPEYWQAIAQIKSCKKYQWKNEQGQVTAYLAFDRGKDLGSIVHEWGGEPNALYMLLATILKLRPDLLWLTHPDLKDPIRQALPETWKQTPYEGCLGLVKSLKGDLSDKLKHIWFWGLDSL